MPIKSLPRLLAILLAAAPLTLVANSDTSECSHQSPQGALCQWPVTAIKPTQFSVGMVKVRCNQAKIEQKKRKKLAKWLKKSKNHIPAVIAPDGQIYITDRHHLATALFHAHSPKQRWNEIAKQPWLTIEYNFYTANPEQRLTMPQFWDNMAGRPRWQMVSRIGDSGSGSTITKGAGRSHPASFQPLWPRWRMTLTEPSPAGCENRAAISS